MVLAVQVDLVVDAAEPESHHAVGRAAADVIYIQDLRSLGHC
jgi:hypothetical protein